MWRGSDGRGFDEPCFREDRKSPASLEQETGVVAATQIAGFCFLSAVVVVVVVVDGGQSDAAERFASAR